MSKINKHTFYHQLFISFFLQFHYTCKQEKMAHLSKQDHSPTLRTKARAY